MTTTETTTIADVIRVRPDLTPSEVGAVMQAEPGLSVGEIIAILDEAAEEHADEAT